MDFEGARWRLASKVEREFRSVERSMAVVRNSCGMNSAALCPEACPGRSFPTKMRNAERIPRWPTRPRSVEMRAILAREAAAVARTNGAPGESLNL